MADMREALKLRRYRSLRGDPGFEQCQQEENFHQTLMRLTTR